MSGDGRLGIAGGSRNDGRKSKLQTVLEETSQKYTLQFGAVSPPRDRQLRAYYLSLR
jgi:hypothetical protein